MSGTNFLGDQAVIRALAKRLTDSTSTLTLAEESGLSRFFGSTGLSTASPTGLPAASGGDVNGWNSLCRTNWFNGRFLTAEALRRQDTYFDYRARLDAQTLMPGVAYGLGLDADGLNTTSYSGRIILSGGFPADRAITLQPGLAMDMIGRPILVPAAFQFTLADLIALQKSNPRRVVGGGTEFAPCICLAPDPAGPTGGSAAPPPGPYLLIIEAAEQPSGDAKVYGSVCSDSQPVTCQSDTWCAGFGLSLVRFPVDVPVSEKLLSAWDLRGVLSAYFFDVFEHSLIKRWDPTFATDDGFCIGAGPGRKDTGAVALAMVYLGTDGTALWMDSWIPRRSIVATPGEDWHRTRFGAPPRSAAWARIYQFQCMLSESLAAQPITDQPDSNQQSALQNLNLLRRGFRHIPPIGFLPVSPQEAKLWTDPTTPNTGDARLDAVLKLGGAQAGLVSGFIIAAREQARSYFANTNVIAYCVVALHDDDILEDLANVFDKDPVQIDAPPPVDDRLYAILTGSTTSTTTASSTSILLKALEAVLLEASLADLVNRRIEVVKLVVPLQGLTRSHPVLGVVAEDAQNQAQSWGATPATGAGAGAFDMAGLAQQAGLDMLPRHFVVYVKQRLVLLDVIFTLLELLQLLIARVVKAAPAAAAAAAAAAAPAAGTAPAAGGLAMNNYAATQVMRTQWQALPANDRALAQAALAHPSVQATIARALPLLQPDLAVASRTTSFQKQVDAQDTALQATVKDATQRRQLAIDRVADSYAAVYPGYQFVQLISATQPPDTTDALLRAVGEGAATNDALALAPAQTAEDASLKDGIPIFTSSDSALLFAQLRTANAEQNISALLPSVKSDLTVGDILAMSPDDATAQLGGAQDYARFRSAYAAETKKAADAATAIVAPPAGVTGKLQDALTQNAGDVTKAVEATRTATGTDAATRHYLDSITTVATILGPDRTKALAPALLRASPAKPA